MKGTRYEMKDGQLVEKCEEEEGRPIAWEGWMDAVIGDPFYPLGITPKPGETVSDKKPSLTAADALAVALTGDKEKIGAFCQAAYGPIEDPISADPDFGKPSPLKPLAQQFLGVDFGSKDRRYLSIIYNDKSVHEVLMVKSKSEEKSTHIGESALPGVSVKEESVTPPKARSLEVAVQWMGRDRLEKLVLESARIFGKELTWNRLPTPEELVEAGVQILNLYDQEGLTNFILPVLPEEKLWECPLCGQRMTDPPCGCGARETP